MAERWVRKPLTDNLRTAVDSGALPANARRWEREVEDGTLQVIRTVEPHEGRWRVHVSISHRGPDDQPGRYPTWDEQKEACHRLGAGKAFVHYMPGPDDPYVNHHSTTFHWWETDPWK